MRLAIPILLLGLQMSSGPGAGQPAFVDARDLELARLFVSSCMTYDTSPGQLLDWIAGQKLKSMPWNPPGFNGTAFIEPDRMLIIPTPDGACTVLADQVDKTATERILRGFFAANGFPMRPVPGAPELGTATGPTGEEVTMDHQAWLIATGSQGFPDDYPGLSQVSLMAAPVPP